MSFAQMITAFAAGYRRHGRHEAGAPMTVSTVAERLAEEHSEPKARQSEWVSPDEWAARHSGRAAAQVSPWFSPSQIPEYARFRVPGYSPSTVFERRGPHAVPVNEGSPTRDIYVLAVAYADQGGLVPEPVTMTVTVRDRSAESPWGSGPVNPATRQVTISAYCPQCGQHRGDPQGRNQVDDGARYWVQVWKNPCGHVDRYTAVIEEARRLAEQDRTAPHGQ